MDKDSEHTMEIALLKASISILESRSDRIERKLGLVIAKLDAYIERIGK